MNHIKPCGTLITTDIKLRKTESMSQKQLRKHKYLILNKGNQKKEGGGESVREEIDPGFYQIAYL